MKRMVKIKQIAAAINADGTISLHGVDNDGWVYQYYGHKWHMLSCDEGTFDFPFKEEESCGK